MRALITTVVFGLFLLTGCKGVVSGAACVGSCEGRECGDDGCGQVCGTCADGIACDPIAGVCAALCGNGMLDGVETCDPPGSCPTECDDADVCTTDAVVGTAESCSVQCEYTPITMCVTGDRCCAPGCDGTNDGDCDPVCGNGVLEGDETCENGEGATPCVTACDDGDLCTEDVLVGSPATCNAACEFRPITTCVLDHARGVEITGISIDQGVRIPLAAGETAVEPGDRNGPLIAGRAALVRADWFLPEGAAFVEREIRAVLSLRYPDGVIEEVESTQTTVERAAYSYDDFRDGYSWRLTGEQVKPGTEYSVELFEVDPSYREQPLPQTPPRFPAEPDTFVDLGVPDTRMVMRVVLVPFDHDLGNGCDPPPDITGNIDVGGASIPEYEYYAQRLMALNPIAEVEVIPHEPVRFTGSAQNAGDILTRLRQLREEDGAEPWMFYYGVINPCDGGPNFSGVANRPGVDNDEVPFRSQARSRVGWGEYRTGGRHAGTFVHEIGHEQGRRHVDCGGPAGPDPLYPNGTGNIGVFGWDIFTNEEIVLPDHKDYMSYCGPRWVSEYGWSQVYPWIAEMSSWELESAFTVPRKMLYASIDPGQSDQWWTGTETGRENNEGLERGYTVRFFRGSEQLSVAPAEYEEVPEDDAFFLSVQLPDSWSDVTHIAWSDGASQTVVDVGRVRQIR